MFNLTELFTLKKKLFVIAGPCVIEEEDTVFKIAESLKSVSEALDMPLIFKSSFDKANRTSMNSYRGPGIKKGLRILEYIREKIKLPVLTDIHTPEQVKNVSQVVDILQIPAFLCRQTDLLLEAGRTGKVVNVKKGQFLAPEDIRYAVEKIESTGNRKILLTERGTSFGYHQLVVDFRGIPIMKQFGYPVVFDATHSVQLPGAGTGVSSGERGQVIVLARAAVAVGCDGLFLEVHLNPNEALCDGPNMLSLEQLPSFLAHMKTLKETVERLEADSRG